MNIHYPMRCRGAGLIEVLVTIVILMIGLLGLAKLQGVAVASQTEAYQRSQALVLLKDMADRLNVNRQNALTYVTAAPLGTGGTGQPANCAGLTGKDLDFCQWHYALLGAAEKRGNDSVGAMIGARGCIYNTDANVPRQFLVVVAWQGLHKTAENAAIDCGIDAYGDRAMRRMVTLTLTIANLN